MASSSSTSKTWSGPGTDRKANAVVIQRELIPRISTLTHVSILNGDASTMTPYLQRSTVPTIYRWCPVGGIDPREAISMVDAFIKCHLYHITKNAPADKLPADIRKEALILGVTRAVMTGSHELHEGCMVPGEMAPTYISATKNEEGRITYNAYPDMNPKAIGKLPVTPGEEISDEAKEAAEKGKEEEQWTDHSHILKDPLKLSETEMEAIEVLVKFGLCIVPIQGHNLLAEGHHYLSGAGRQGQRACLTIEKQVVTSEAMKGWFGFSEGLTRDVLWHKSGHPVDVFLKMRSATQKKTAENLVAMGLGSAAARLPAIESEARPVSAYLKLAQTVRATFEAHGGLVDTQVLEEIMLALNFFPIGADSVANERGVPITMTVGSLMDGPLKVECRNRREVLDYIKMFLPRIQDKVAALYGFYKAMVEDTADAGEGGRGGGESLTKAHSLRKLRDECLAAYAMGVENYKDYRAYKGRVRNATDFKSPDSFLH